MVFHTNVVFRSFMLLEITGKLSLVFTPNLSAVMVSHTNAMRMNINVHDMTGILTLITATFYIAKMINFLRRSSRSSCIR